jgi:glycerophosphoryl diester phosphodiesterase
VFQPELPEFVTLVLGVLEREGVKENTTLQAFDVSTLLEIKRQDTEVELSLLVDEGENYEQKLSELGFYPPVLSPSASLVDEKMMGFATQRQMRVIPWTVNEKAEMERLMDLGVSGIITDYPDVLVALVGK